MLNPYKAIQRLINKIRTFRSDNSINDSEFYTIRKEYNAIIRKFGGYYIYKKDLQELTAIYEDFRCRYCADSATVSIPMANNLDGLTTVYPVGVFNVNGDFLGVANNSFEYVTLWNSDPANQVEGEMLVSGGLSSTTFLLPSATATITKATGLRYYEITGPSNLQLFCGDNDIIHYGSTIKKGNVDGVSITNTTRREWNRNLFAGVYKSTVPSDTVRTLNCTGYTNGSSLKVFHNEDSEYAAVSFSNGFYTISGSLPIGLKACFWSGQMGTDYNAITNWDELTNLFSWYSLSSGGVPWGMDPTKFPTDIISSNITQLGVGENTTGGFNGAFITEYSYINATNYPILEDLVVIWNSGEAITGSESWFLTMPKVTNYFRYNTQTVTQSSAEVADAIWNNVATALDGVIPVGPAKELRIIRTDNVTAASLTARNALISAGWTVTTN